MKLVFTRNGLDRDSPVEQVTAALKDAIASGQLKPGQQLPSIRRLVSDHALSYHTVVRAYERLASSGLVSVSQGRGFFVEVRPEPVTLPSHAPSIRNPSEHSAAFTRLFRSDRDMKLGCGWLPPAWRDTDALARVIRRTANFAHSSLVEYGDPLGYLPLRENLVRHLHARLGLPIAADQILTTLGATQALDLVIRALLALGDTVLVDDPCNSNLIQLLALRGVRIVGCLDNRTVPISIHWTFF